MKIAALDSSGLVASVAILEDDTLIAEYTVNYKKTHSQTLLPMLETVKNMIELDLGTLDAIAVAAGPGSFTGLRIGSATAKGLGLALNIPIIPVPTIDALAYNLYGTDKLICPIMDARRDQVYTGLYDFIQMQTGECRLRQLLEQSALSIEDIAAKINQLGWNVIFLGDGVPVFQDRLKELIKVPYSFAPAHKNRQSAAAVGALGEVLFREGNFQTAAEHAPNYLRVSQAERERNETVVIRRMTEADLEEVSRLEESAFSMPWSVDAFREMVNHPDAIYLVADDHGKICGTAGVRDISGEGEITNVVIREEYRGSGLGQRLMQELLQAGTGKGIAAFTLEVRKGNAAAIHVYEKLGFVSAGIRPHFYEKPEEDAVIMWRR